MPGFLKRPINIDSAAKNYLNELWICYTTVFKIAFVWGASACSCGAAPAHSAWRMTSKYRESDPRKQLSSYSRDTLMSSIICYVPCHASLKFTGKFWAGAVRHLRNPFSLRNFVSCSLRILSNGYEPVLARLFQRCHPIKRAPVQTFDAPHWNTDANTSKGRFKHRHP